MLTLHNHSFYTLLKGCNSPQKIVDHSKMQNENYAALTDTNGMYGVIQFAKYAEQNNIKPIIGAEIDDPADNNLKAIFIAKNNAGYSKLCALITARKLKDDFKLADVFKENLSDFFIISSSLELLNYLNQSGLNKEQTFAELIITKKSKQATRKLYDFARGNKIKIIASRPTYFASKEDFMLHKILSAIKHRSTITSISEDQLVDEEYHFQTKEEFENEWKKIPEALKSIDFIVRNSNVNFDFGKLKFPVFNNLTDEEARILLLEKCYTGLKNRYKKVTEKILTRMHYELDVINGLGFSNYFLIVWDLVQEAKRRNMMLIGRGSAANSLVAYCLGFTQVDPIKYDLYFERFLNKGRKSPPDVDLDFSWRERDEIVKYVFDKYGYDKVAMISTHVTFRARSAFREVAKVFGIPDSEISKYSKFIPWTSAANLPVISEKFPEAKSIKFDSEPWISVINYAKQLSSFPRHLSIHPSGLVISPEPINKYVALEFAKNKGLGLIITQPDMYSIEDMGLVKIDLLSQRSLGVLRDTIMMIKE